MINELKFLIEIVKKAEEISKECFSVKSKGTENDLVTNLDIKIENFLIDQIKIMYPNYDIVSEEKNYNKKLTDNCFVIDPIDGTINFANNLPLWAIQVACIKNGKTIAAVIDIPKINEFYYADENGAYLNDKKIKVSQVPLKNSLYVVDASNNLQAMINMIKHTINKRIFGAVSVSMAFTAAGRIHGSVFRSDKPWDYIPGLYLIKMAGGVIEDKSGFHAGTMNEEFLNILRVETSKLKDNKNVFVLHSLNGDTLQFWGEDIKLFCAEKGVDCFMPQFPIRADSSYNKFNEILTEYLNNGKLNNNSVVICHSIGNPYFIRFCREHNYIPNCYVSVAPGAVYEYPQTRNDYIIKVKKQAYLKDIDFKYGKNLKNIYCLYSDEDDGNIEKFSRFINDFNAKPIYLKGYNHFDGYHRIYKIPELNELLTKLL